ncbi:MAG: hypothetical protein JWN03_299 [Nocardia sp.]|uniref:hypothetical protein n=1 Tax=Nocardia sp. TaxID=1821 RepID=UPI00261B8674|nr:hypothetical protein [Nocardia sp.]MCU1640024.1 hypothetical protein [Nocardia sp.]
MSPRKAAALRDSDDDRGLRDHLVATAQPTSTRSTALSGPLPPAGTATVAENLESYLHAGLALHRAVVPVFAGLLATPAVLTRFAESEEHDQNWRNLLARYLSAERDLCRLAPAVDLDAALAVLVGICHDQALTALLPGTPHTPTDVPAVVTTLLTGIGTA